MTSSRLVTGREVQVGDILYLGPGFQVERFEPYKFHEFAVVGPGRVAYRWDGEPMIIYDDTLYAVVC